MTKLKLRELKWQKVKLRGSVLHFSLNKNILKITAKFIPSNQFLEKFEWYIQVFNKTITKKKKKKKTHR